MRLSLTIFRALLQTSRFSLIPGPPRRLGFLLLKIRFLLKGIRRGPQGPFDSVVLSLRETAGPEGVANQAPVLRHRLVIADVNRPVTFRTRQQNWLSGAFVRIACMHIAG
ncbi:MAG TPA: hypothetical protein VJ718_03560, partial [Candidatus Binataceae bacterium]|nr:hypothetical protein [Candidatus Binataceae bacterium]